MTPDLAKRVREAESLYGRKWKDQLEQSHEGFFVAVVPESEEYFLGKTYSEATTLARQLHPDSLPHVIRVGHPAAFTVG